MIANICTTFAGGSQYKYNGASRFEFSSIDKYGHYSYLEQLGFCIWISNQNPRAIEDVLHTLESWTVRTYEVRMVSYTIIIDLDIDSKINNGKYFSAFLKT